MRCGWSLKVQSNFIANQDIFTVVPTFVVILRLDQHLHKVLKSFEVGLHLRLANFCINLEEVPLEEANLEVDDLDGDTSDDNDN